MYGYQNPYYPGPMPDQLAQLRQTPAPQQGNGILWVSGEQEARNYLLAPNSAVALWDSGSPCVYFKQSDASGRPTFKIYDIVERVETPPAAKAEYVTRDEFEALAARLDALTPKKKAAAKEAEEHG